MTTITSSQTVSGIRVHPSGAVDPVDIDAANLDDGICKAIGADMPQFLELYAGLDAIVDDNGMSNRKAPNERASLVAAHLGFKFWPGDWLKGTVLFLAANDDGRSISLTTAQRDVLAAALELFH